MTGNRFFIFLLTKNKINKSSFTNGDKETGLLSILITQGTECLILHKTLAYLKSIERICTNSDFYS